MSRVYLIKGDKRYMLIAKGHATGSVEMCAAISALIYTLAGYLENYETKVAYSRIESADVVIIFYGENAELLFDLMSVGFQQLEYSDPEHIHVEIKN